MQQQKQFKFLVLLGIMCATFLHLALLFQSDLVAVGSIYFSATIFVYPFTCIILDIITEVYGYKLAKQTLWATIFANIIFGLTTVASTKLPSPAFWTHYDQIYAAAMKPIFPTVFVGIASIIVGQFVNIYVISRLGILVKGRFFALRSMTSTIVGDTLTVAIALTLNFSRRMPAGNIFIIIISELLIMYGFAIVFSFPASILTYWLKKVEPIYNQLNFNPFGENDRKLDNSVNKI